MPSAVEITGDIAAAATALAGLVLVFIGAAATAFDAFERQEQHTVRAKFQARAWIAFVAFVLALIAAVTALFGKWFSQSCLGIAAFAILIVALFFSFLAALSAVRGIK